MQFFVILMILFRLFLWDVAVNMGIAGCSLPAKTGKSATFYDVQGFGSTTPGGQDGKVYRVNSLAERGPGSLRDAVQASGPRIIVFDVSGTIHLHQDLIISQPFVTVAGQSAPTPGITLRGAGIRVETHDVVLQHLRIRVGDDPVGPSPRSRDGLQITGPSAFNIIADHLSVSWAVDENVSITRGAHDITISNSIISEALNSSLHPEGRHSMGILVGEGCFRVALIRNLLAHNSERNPRIKGDSAVLAVNNLAYNCANNAFVVVGSPDGPSFVSLVGNVFLPGPDTPYDIKAIHFSSRAHKLSKLYLLDNLLAERPSKPLIFSLAALPPIWNPAVKIYPARKIEALLMQHAGARPRERDPIDRRIVEEVFMRTGQIINSQKEIGGWSLPVNADIEYFGKKEVEKE